MTPRGNIQPLLAVFLAVAFLSSCHHVPLERPLSLPLGAPPELLQPFRPSRAGEELELELIEETDEHRRYRLRFSSDTDEAGAAATVVEGEYLEVASASAEAPAPLLQIAPILGGAGNDYLAARVFASWALDDGFSSFFLFQEANLLAPELGGAGIGSLLERTTAENIQALELLAQLEQVDGARLGCFGISLGAIKNVLLLAAEPSLQGGILCLPGGDLARIFASSREKGVEEYFAARTASTGLGREEILAELEANLDVEPLELAPYVGAERVILFLGALDDKVPYTTGLELYRALRRPELHVLPLGHYTGMIAAPSAAETGFAWLRARFERDDDDPSGASTPGNKPSESSTGSGRRGWTLDPRVSNP